MQLSAKGALSTPLDYAFGSQTRQMLATTICLMSHLWSRPCCCSLLAAPLQGFDTENEALVYACSNGIPPPPAGGPTLPEQAQGNPAAPGQQGHRKLLSSTHDHTGHHHHHNHHHHHHRRQILQKKGQNSPPAPAPAPAPSPSPAPVPSPSPAPATAAVVPEVASGWMVSKAGVASGVDEPCSAWFELYRTTYDTAKGVNSCLQQRLSAPVCPCFFWPIGLQARHRCPVDALKCPRFLQHHLASD